ncbi:MAG: transcriptional regulator [Syntrophobacteraceae bacterium]|jgi:HTH-type transcriptional regulator/antitoxin HigA|nr:transcriptional regulator [Syntrophobacteraceae bacterium]
MNTQLKEIAKVWPDMRDFLCVPHNEKEYKRLVGLLDKIIDEVGNDESHPLASLMETLGSLIEMYEAQRIPEIEGDPIDSLKALIEEHNINQSDLPEIGTQGVVSEVLSGKRKLNIRQVKALSKRFNVSPAVFI